MTTYVRGACPVWWMCDLQGLPLNDTYFAFFLDNVFPYTFQDVFENYLPGSNAWSNPVQFFADGTLPNNIYFDPDLVYTIEIRQGNTQNSPLIRQILNYQQPDDQSVLLQSFDNSTNVFVNPQFADLSFISPLSLNTAGTYNIAPGWDLKLVGTGTATITQNTISGDSAGEMSIANGVSLANPPYSLTFGLSGWSSAILYQRLSNNGAIFAGGSIAVTVSAVSGAGTLPLTAQYVDSQGNSSFIDTWQVTSGYYQNYPAAINVPVGSSYSTNTDIGQAAYVDLQFVLPNTGTISLTNMQLLGQTDVLPTVAVIPPYIQQTYEQVVSAEFAYYKPQIFYKPISSYLVGWDFPLNPAQAIGHSISAQATGNNKAFYAWDQTVFFQSLTNGFTITQSNDGAMSVAAAVVNPQFAIIQYLPNSVTSSTGGIATEILNNILSANFYGYCDSGQTVPINISLWYTTGSLPSAGSGNSPILTLGSDGHPATTAAGWVEIPFSNGQHANATVLPQSNSVMNYPFSNWNLNNPSIADTATFFAIIVGTGMITNTKALYIRSVSLVPGHIPTQPAPQTPDQVLRECQYYYEKSYDIAILPGATGTSPGEASAQPSSNALVMPGLNTAFKTAKYTDPVIVWYSPGASGASGNIYDVTGGADLAVSSTIGAGQSRTGYPVCSAATANHLYTGHWTADCRLGV
jgi:hypothetical protein